MTVGKLKKQISWDQLSAAVEKAVQETLRASGRPPVPLFDGMRVLIAVDGFDSLTGIEAAFLVAAELGCDLNKDIEYFKTRDGARAATLAEAVARMAEELGI